MGRGNPGGMGGYPPGFWGPTGGGLELGREGIKSRGSPAGLVHRMGSRDGCCVVCVGSIFDGTWWTRRSFPWESVERSSNPPMFSTCPAVAGPYITAVCVLGLAFCCPRIVWSFVPIAMTELPGPSSGTDNTVYPTPRGTLP